MIAQTSFVKRKPKADVARQFVGVLSRNKEGKLTVLVVPGSNGKQYHVIVRRYPNKNLITMECHLNVGAAGMEVCPGNYVTICYHSRAAFDFVVAESGMKTAWCEDLQSVSKLMKLHKDARYYNVRSHQSGKQMWVVVYKKG